MTAPVVLRSPSRRSGSVVDLGPPSTGPLVDRFGRVHDDLRMSVTDRCNLRCVYCLPEEGVRFRPQRELLTIDELGRIAGVARSLGVRGIRITGGEPLLRRDLTELVRRLGELELDDLAMTTNGVLLPRLARSLKEAGLQRVNISCDSLRPERFAAIRRRGSLRRALDAMEAAEDAGLRPVKVNVVLMAGWNDDEVVDFATFARETGRVVRFIEFMPLDGEQAWSKKTVVSGAEVLRAVNRVHPLAAVEGWRPGDDAEMGDGGHAPAERFRFADGRGEIGIVSSVTRPFCDSCNRLRVTADGQVRNCLFSDDELSVARVLRRGGSDAEIAGVLRRSVWAKRAGHGMDRADFVRPARSMSMIGG